MDWIEVKSVLLKMIENEAGAAPRFLILIGLSESDVAPPLNLRLQGSRFSWYGLRFASCSLRFSEQAESAIQLNNKDPYLMN
jgi:hypothetical protein